MPYRVLMRVRALFRALVFTLPVTSGLAVLGCTTRQHFTGPYPATFPPDQQVEVWQGVGHTVLRNVTIDAAAVRGQRVTIPACDSSCSVAIPRVDADSVVLVNHDSSITVLGIAAFLAFLVLHPCIPGNVCT